MNNIKVSLSIGLKKEERKWAAMLFWESFSEKLNFFLGPRRRAEKYIEIVLNEKNVFVARDDRGNLVALSGFRSEHMGVIGGNFSDLINIYGLFGALWRIPFLNALGRTHNIKTLHLDAVCVQENCRGKGVGGEMIKYAKKFAKAKSFYAIELDVVSNNARAIRFYNSLNFYLVSNDRTGFLGSLLGFKSINRMRLDL